ncbi:MAG: FtsX-like permease family protein [Gemmatimonadota bacterium]
MSGFGFVLAMAGRESRAARGRLLLLTASITIGVAALVAINSFTANLRTTVRDQAQSLLGADVAVTGRAAYSPRAVALVDSVAGCAQSPCANVARVTNFSAMAYAPRGQGARLVQVAAIEGRYPFYGKIRTDPAPAWDDLQQSRRVIVDPSLLTVLDARVGDSLALGEIRFEISGTVIDVPGDVGIQAAFGPRVFIPARYLLDTKLLLPGSRAEYERYIRLASGDAQVVARRLRSALAAERITVRTVEDDRRNLDQALDQLGRYLGLVALIALLLGGLGVASAVHVFIRRKIDTIAVLRCLGASARQLFGIYLVQAAAMGLAGSIAGALIGILLQVFLPQVFSEFLPVELAFHISWTAVGVGVGTGVLVSLLFALLPLLSVRQVSPLLVLRREYDQAPRRTRDRWRWPTYLVIAVAVVLIAAFQVGSLLSGALFALAIGVVLALLALAAFLLIRALRRWFPARLPYLFRQGLANLYRPANQTLTVVLALGFGAFLLSTLYLVQENLLRSFQFGSNGPRANFVLFDIQPEQRVPLENLLRDSGYPSQPAVPIVPMRILSVKGKPVGRILADSAPVGDDGEPLGRWAFRREYRSTYRDTTVASEKKVAGDWWKTGAGSEAVVPISMETGVAGELGVTVGDTIVWDVQGLPITTRIVNLREVNWARFEPNFFVVFPVGPLESAPQMFVALTRIPDPAERGRVQRGVVERFPNVTTIDLSQLQESIETLLDKVILVVRFMALFSLATGGIVLVGAVATSRFQRVREGVLLRTLGATRNQLLQILLVEYFCLGMAGVLTAFLLSVGAAWLLMKYLFDASFGVPVGALSGLAAGVIVLTVTIGFANSTEIFRKPPLEVLRAE